MAEPITKELNPIYGSIQKLHQRYADLITLCEDKALRIDQRRSGRDALYNTEGNPNVTATQNVLGQAIPYIGDYGISKNPESFASEAFRVYFADKQRGAVLRLSRDGLTPISNYGMKTWFNDNLEFASKIVGSYDTVKSLYNISLQYKYTGKVMTFGGFKSPETQETSTPVGNKVWTLYDFVKSHRRTLSFRDQINGWTSFKSFKPETGLSLNNKYYTTWLGELWRHHDPLVGRGINYVYNRESSITVLLNDSPSSVKSFTTLNYEGSQSRVIQNNLENDGGDSPWTGQYYNSTDKDGWWCNNITTINEATGNQNGTVKEFINKEGKWFNHIRGEGTSWGNNPTTQGGRGNVDTQEFSVQGIGELGSVEEIEICGCIDDGFRYSEPGVVVSPYPGIQATNYNPDPNILDCNCDEQGTYALDWDSCCEYQLALEAPEALSGPHSATCTDFSSTSYCAQVANLTTTHGNPQSFLTWQISGYNHPVFGGCSSPNHPNGGWFEARVNAWTNTLTNITGVAYRRQLIAKIDWANCMINECCGIGGLAVYGCMDDGNKGNDYLNNQGTNANPQYGSVDPGTAAVNYYAGATQDDGNCIYSHITYVVGCTDPTAINYDPNANLDCDNNFVSDFNISYTGWQGTQPVGSWTPYGSTTCCTY